MKHNDKISMEYEARTMISEALFTNLINDHTKICTPNVIINRNFYFDTAHFDLIKRNIVLRKRIVNESAEFTLKIKTDYGDKEITIECLPNADITFIKNSSIDNILSLNGIYVDNLKLLTNLETLRYEYNIDDCLIVVDKNSYSNIIDFNLEIEAPSLEKANNKLFNLSKIYNFEITTNYLPKTKRAILSIKD